MGIGRSLDQIDLGYQYHSTAVIEDGSPDADPPGSSYTPTAIQAILNTILGR